MLTIHQQIVVIRNTVSLLFETVPLPPVRGEQKLRNNICAKRETTFDSRVEITTEPVTTS